MDIGALIVHIPHSSIHIPLEYEGDNLLTDRELQHELLIMTDRFVDELFAFEGVQSHINPISRLVMDPERFRSDQIEPMAKVGMGAIYTLTSGGKPLRRITPDQREKILVDLYDPYHAKMSAMVDDVLRKYDTCLIIDAHSFSSEPLQHEILLGDGFRISRPDICLGYEEQHSDRRIIKMVENYFIKCDFSVAHNYPFMGSFVPMKHYRQDSRVLSLMIELNRSLYMNERTGCKSKHFEIVREKMEGLFKLLINL